MAVLLLPFALAKQGQDQPALPRPDQELVAVLCRVENDLGVGGGQVVDQVVGVERDRIAQGGPFGFGRNP
jgi:hypothetical protein